MTESQAIEAIWKRWNDTWPSTSGSVPFVFDNEGALTSAEWARVSVTHTTAQQTTMGQAPSRRFERRGFVIVQLFAPIDSGVKRAADLCGFVRTVFEGQSLLSGSGVVHLYEAATEEVPADGTWCMRVVRVRFRYIDTR